jgi:uncharacterized protein (TIGR03000 family)
VFNRIKLAIFGVAALAAFGFTSSVWAQHGHHGHGHGHHHHGHHGHHHHGHHHHYGHHHHGHHHHHHGHLHHHHGGFGFYISPFVGYGSWPYYSDYGYRRYYDDYGYYGNGYYGNGSAYNGGIVYQPRALTVARPVNVVNVEVRLPDAEAECWLQGVKQGGRGTVRRYQSPELDPNKDYTYTISAAWHDNGRLVTEERRVSVRANSSVVVDFTKPEQSADRPSTSTSTPPPPAEPPPAEPPPTR